MSETGPKEGAQTARRRHTPEQVIEKLREAEVATVEGSTVAEASGKIRVTEQTFYRCRAEYGGLRMPSHSQNALHTLEELT